MKKHNLNLKSGQALVVLIVFVAIATIVVGSAVVVTIVNSRLASDVTQSADALAAAEAGANEAILSLLRNPNYSGGTLAVGPDVATITISGAPSKTIVSSASVGGYVRKVEVLGTYSGNAFAISSWKEIN